MMDPNQIIEAFKTKTSSLLVPTSPIHATHTNTATSSVAPIPSVTGTPVQHRFETVSETGTKTLWVVFVVMLASTLIFTYLSWRVPVQKRLFHVITTFITLFATISYFAMATGDGNSYTRIVIKEAHKHVPDTYLHVFRQVFWARYIDWSVTTPLLLLDLAFLAGMDGASIIVAIVADVIMVLTGLFAAFGHSDGQKWGYYAIACIAYLVIVWQLVISGRRAVSAKDSKTAKLFGAIGAYTLILWTLYPIVWGIGDGARKWSVDAEIIAYAVLDILAKPIFGFWLIFAHAASSSQSLEGWWSSGLGSEGAIRIDDDGA